MTDYINPMLMCDFYKTVHSDMINPKMTKSVSYYTPRMTRVKRWDSVVNFGLQMFIKTYLVDYFNKYFFERPENEVTGEFERVLSATLSNVYNSEKIRKLHRLGYLPVEIDALPEGEKVPVHVPMFSITNTHPDFAWLPQALESLISAEVWYPQITATVGATYRDIVNKYYSLTCDDDVKRSKALGAFDFRGDYCLDSALKASAGWCLSFENTATVPAIPYLEKMFDCDCTENSIAYGSVSTEHFVMCSNYAYDGDEVTFLRKMLTELYPNTSFSAVLDSYDYWNVIDNILPQIHDEIMNHNGCMLMRGDSGDCTEVVTETVFRLWEQFGGTVNSKGYKVLDPHVKAIYGDSITIQRCEKIYEILMENGFSCCNVALGVGSFSMHCIEEDGVLKPFTRDTFGCAVKACYAEIDGREYPVFKNPKGESFKKSQKGLCFVYRDGDGKLAYKDGFTSSTIPKGNLLEPVFRDGKILKQYTLDEIRHKLNGGYF
ncbi:MAG: nicotinate phosphoribosyltransferase [Ruminococcus sp.]|nr:nicotinate phosphoribosyltransferase [Ruminococcus sp.]